MQQKGNKRLTSRRYNTIQRADYYNRPNHTGGNNTFQYGQAETRPLPYMDNQQQERAIICPISHYKETSSTTYHQRNKKSTHGK